MSDELVPNPDEFVFGALREGDHVRVVVAAGGPSVAFVIDLATARAIRDNLTLAIDDGGGFHIDRAAIAGFHRGKGDRL